MFENPMILIGGFIESFIIALLGGLIFNVASLNQFTKFAVINSLCVYLSRALILGVFGLSLGVNTIISFLLAIVIFKYVFNIKWLLSTLIAIISYFAIIASEILFAQNTLSILNTTLNKMLNNTIIHNEFILINAMPIFIFACVIWMINKITNRKEIINENREYCQYIVPRK